MKRLILALFLAPLLAWAQPTPAGGAPAATQTEVDAGVVANKYVSPLTLDNWSGGGGGGTPGGSDTQLQYNNAGAFGGTAATYNNSTGVFTFLGSFISTPAPITLVANSGTLDITDRYSSVTVTANSTLAPSAAGADGQTCAVKVTNAQATSLTLTMNNSGTDYVTTIPVGFVWITYISNGTDWIPTTGSPAAGTSASTSLVYLSNPTTRVDFTDTVANISTLTRVSIIEKIAVFSVDGGGSAVTGSTTVAISGTARVPFACTLTGVSITATGATGTNTVKFWKKATGTAIPTSSDSINTSGISLTTGTAVLVTSMSDFTGGVAPVFAAGDMVRALPFAVDGTATDLTVTLYGTRL